MTATAHILVGGAIAASIPNPVVGVSLAVVSHPLLDLIPHWDFGLGWRNKNRAFFLMESLFDLAFGLVLSYLLFGRYTNLLYFGVVVVASIILDLLLTPYWFLKWHFPPFSWVYKMQSRMNAKAQLPWGILNQVITVALVIVILNIFH